MLHNSATGAERFLHKVTMCQSVVRIEITGKGVTIEMVQGVTTNIARGVMTNMGQGVTTMTTIINREFPAFSVRYFDGPLKEV